MMVVNAGTMDDGTLVITVSDMTGINRVNVREADTHYGDLYYRDGGFKEGYEAAQKTFEPGKEEAQLNWIPIAKGLPKKEGLYYVTEVDEDGTRYTIIRHFAPKWKAEWIEESVIAWMPRPEPYKGNI